MAATRRRFLKLASFALAAPAVSHSAFAADWPKEKIIRVTIPFNPGASIDITGRIVCDALSQQIGQTIVIENRAGAGGAVGTAQVARAEPDGYTLLINGSSHTVAPAIFKNLACDTANDIAGVAVFGDAPNVLLVAPNKGYETVQDLVAKAKSSDLTFGSSGVGSATHWSIERFRAAAQFKATHVPYRSGVESVTEVMTGRIDFCCVGIPGAMGFIKDGLMKPLCVLARKRSPWLPNVISINEAGYKDADYVFWLGMLAPSKTPRPIIERLNIEVAAVLAKPELRQKLEIQGVDTWTATPAEFDTMIHKEIQENVRIAKDAGLEPR
jgi:tripartite-type tricarboxylate transporter receptor subunit TctC